MSNDFRVLLLDFIGSLRQQINHDLYVVNAVERGCHLFPKQLWMSLVCWDYKKRTEPSHFCELQELSIKERKRESHTRKFGRSGIAQSSIEIIRSVVNQQLGKHHFPTSIHPSLHIEIVYFLREINANFRVIFIKCFASYMSTFGPLVRLLYDLKLIAFRFYCQIWL